MDAVFQARATRPVPAALVLAIFSSRYDEIEQVIVDGCVDGRVDPSVGRDLLYAARVAEVAPC
jgi:hypothetical protein